MSGLGVRKIMLTASEYVEAPGEDHNKFMQKLYRKYLNWSGYHRMNNRMNDNQSRKLTNKNLLLNIIWTNAYDCPAEKDSNVTAILIVFDSNEFKMIFAHLANITFIRARYDNFLAGDSTSKIYRCIFPIKKQKLSPILKF